MATITYTHSVSLSVTTINTSTGVVGVQYDPDIAVLNNGTVVSGWNYNGNGLDGVIRNASGGSQNATSTGLDGVSATSQFEVSALAGGNFVVAYQDDSVGAGNRLIVFRLFDSNFNIVAISDSTSPVVVSTQGGDQLAPSITTLIGGRFVISWVDVDPGGANDAFFRVYEANGTAVTVEKSVLGTTGTGVNETAVASLVTGGFVMAWSEADSGGGTEIRYLRYDNNGTAVGTTTLVDTFGSINDQLEVLGLNDGGFVIAYRDDGWGSGNTDITLAWFDSSGTIRSYSQVNLGATTAGDQGEPSLTLLQNGFVAVSYTRNTANSHGQTEIAFYDPTTITRVHTVFWSSGDQGQLATGQDGRFFLVDQNSDDDIGLSAGRLVRTTTGDATSEILTGDVLRDIINGNDGSDFIIGGGGGDAMDGGGAGGFDSVSWFNSATGVQVNLLANTFAGGAAGDTVSGFEAYYLSNVGDTFTNNNAGGYVYGFGGNDIITGGTGSDVISGGAGGDTINGGDGFDYALLNDTSSSFRLDLGNAASNTGIAAGDTYTNVEAYYLGGGSDTFIGAATGQNFVFAGNGGDQLVGGATASNWLFGEGGNDLLIGGSFNDLLSGGANADIYRFNSWVGNGFDSILDFVSGTDTIVAIGSGFGLLTGTTITNGVNFISAVSPFATQAQGTFLYATGLGILYYDPDGSGAGAAIALAQISGAPAIAASDIFVL
jgi:hypothetical protein